MEKQSLINIEKVENGFLVALETHTRSSSIFGGGDSPQRKWFMAKNINEINSVLKDILHELKTRNELAKEEEEEKISDLLEDEDY